MKLPKTNKYLPDKKIPILSQPPTHISKSYFKYFQNTYPNETSSSIVKYFFKNKANASLPLCPAIFCCQCTTCHTQQKANTNQQQYFFTFYTVFLFLIHILPPIIINIWLVFMVYVCFIGIKNCPINQIREYLVFPKYSPIILFYFISYCLSHPL